MKKILTATCFAAWSLAALPVQAQWTEVRTDNVIFQGETSSTDAKALVGDFEAYRDAVIRFLGVEPTPSVVPVNIFAIKPDEKFGTLLPYEDFAVLSQKSLGGSAFLINEAAPMGAGSQARQLLLREYALDLIAQYARVQYPYWLQSGLADYLSAVGMEGGVMAPGQPIEKYDYALSRRKWVPMKTVLGAKREFYPLKNMSGNADTEMFQQAQSWAAVKFIMDTPGWRKRLPSYLERLNRGEAPKKAFKRAFGQSSKKFGKLVKQSLSSSNAPPTASISSDGRSPVLASSHLPKMEQALAYGEVLRTFAYTEEGLSAANEALKGLTLTGPKRALGLSSQAEIAAALNDFPAAQSLMSQALRAAPQNGVIQKRAGSLYIGRFQETGDMEWLMPAKTHFTEALKARPDDPAVNYYYADICARIECPQDMSLRAASKAMAYYHDAQYIGTNANLLPIFEANKDTKTLKGFANFARVWGQTP